MLLTLTCAFLACNQPLPTAAPEEGPLLAQATGDITVAYECGNTFLFRNRSLDTLTLTWRVRGIHENGTVFLPARPASAEFSETPVTTKVQGPLEVYRDGRILRTVPNEHGPVCETPPPTSVPMTAPDSYPAWIDADSSIGPDGMTKRIVLVVFKEGATQEQRNAAGAATGGILIGGDPSPLGYEGFYIFQLVNPASIANPDSVVGVLKQLPGVESALKEFHGTGPSWSRPYDGVGWQSTDWSIDPTKASVRIGPWSRCAFPLLGAVSRGTAWRGSGSSTMSSTQLRFSRIP